VPGVTEETTGSSFTITGVSVEIRTDNLMSTSPESYRYIILLGGRDIAKSLRRGAKSKDAIKGGVK
jgi:hypothetical protein